jgi:hypothetical protein
LALGTHQNFGCQLSNEIIALERQAQTGRNGAGRGGVMLVKQHNRTTENKYFKKKEDRKHMTLQPFTDN